MEWIGKVKLCKIPGYNLGNGNIHFFSSPEKRMEFFEQYKIQELEYDNCSYVRAEGGVINIGMNCDKLDTLAPNWIVFNNANFGDKWYFANIISKSYINENVTEITYSTDPVITYMFDMDLDKKSFVIRRTLQYEDGIQKIINAPLESIDIGNEYMVSDFKVDYNNTDEDYKTGQFWYLLMTKDFTNDNSSSHSISTGQYTVKDVDGTDKTIENSVPYVIYGYVLNTKALEELTAKGVLTDDCEYVNTMQDLLLLPFGRSMFPSGIVNIKNKVPKGTELSEGCEIYDHGKFGRLFEQKKIKNLFTNLKTQINKITGENGNGVPTTALGNYLMRYPFSILDINDFINQPDSIKLDCVEKYNGFNFTDENEGLLLTKYGCLGQTPTLTYSVGHYLNSSFVDLYNQSVELAGIANMFGTNFYTLQSTISLPIVTSYLASFLQSNKNSINATRQNLRDTLLTTINNAGVTRQASAVSAAIAQRSAIQSANIAYTNAKTNSALEYNTSIKVAQYDYISSIASAGASASINATTGLANIGVGLLTRQVGGGALAAQGVGQLVGAVTGFGSSYLSANLARTSRNLQAQTQQQVANATAAANQQIAMINANAQAKQALTMAAAEYGNSYRTAVTNYNNGIRSSNAAVQDAKNMPPIVQSMGSGTSIYNVLTDRTCITFATKTIPENVMNRVASYYVTNGYLINEIENVKDVIDSFMSNGKKGIFIQTVNLNIGGDVPPEAIQQIRSVFDGGIYLWFDDNYMDYDAMLKA